MKYIVIDIDGTICKTPTYNTFEEFKTIIQTKNLEIYHEVTQYIENRIKDESLFPLFVTARNVELAPKTHALIKQAFPNFRKDKDYVLLMRPEGNIDCDADLKQMLIKKHLGTIYFRNYITHAIDDKWRNRHMFRSHNISNVIDPATIINEPKLVKSETQGVEMSTTLENEGFKKFDGEKPDLSLCPSLLLEMYHDASSIGAKKYGRNNWKLAEAKDTPRTVAAMLRHFMGYVDGEGSIRGFMNGEYLDKESGKSNLSHALWQLVDLEYKIRKFGWEEVKKYL